MRSKPGSQLYEGDVWFGTQELLFYSTTSFPPSLNPSSPSLSPREGMRKNGHYTSWNGCSAQAFEVNPRLEAYRSAGDAPAISNFKPGMWEAVSINLKQKHVVVLLK